MTTIRIKDDGSIDTRFTRMVSSELARLHKNDMSKYADVCLQVVDAYPLLWEEHDRLSIAHTHGGKLLDILEPLERIALNGAVENFNVRMSREPVELETAADRMAILTSRKLRAEFDNDTSKYADAMNAVASENALLFDDYLSRPNEPWEPERKIGKKIAQLDEQLRDMQNGR